MKEKNQTMILFATFLLVGLGYVFHAINTNPQPDSQLLRYAYELRSVIERPSMILEYFLTQRKYPLLFIAMLETFSWIPASFADIFAQIFSAEPISTEISDAILIVSGRIFILLHAIGIIAIFGYISKREFNVRFAEPLLFSSILFITFATAVRPHIPVTFWTLLACALSLHPRDFS